jgi:hypothetical protein
MRASVVLFLLLVPLILCPACGGATESATQTTTPSSPEPTPTGVVLPPSPPPAGEMTSRITNPWLPLVPGTTLTYEGVVGGEFIHIESRVSRETRRILDVECTVVVVSEYANGELKERTADYFAEDSTGNVWYMGEAVEDYENGMVAGTGGSWVAGVDGAAPGIAMPADPIPGETIPKEFLPGVAQDQAVVIALGVPVTLKDGSVYYCMQAREWNPLDPDEVEYKYYAPGTGLVKESLIDGSDVVELTGETHDED